MAGELVCRAAHAEEERQPGIGHDGHDSWQPGSCLMRSSAMAAAAKAPLPRALGVDVHMRQEVLVGDAVVLEGAPVHLLDLHLTQGLSELIHDP